MPKPKIGLDWEADKNANWYSKWYGETLFEVTHTMMREKFIVDVGKWSCSCNFWKLNGIPCIHNTKFKCSRCHQVGHTIRKCTLSPPIHAIVNEIVSLSNQPPKTNQLGVAVHTRVAFVNSEATSIGNLEVNATNKGKETHDASQPFFSTPNSHN